VGGSFDWSLGWSGGWSDDWSFGSSLDDSSAVAVVLACSFSVSVVSFVDLASSFKGGLFFSATFCSAISLESGSVLLPSV